MSGPAIAGIVVGLLLAAVICGILLVIWICLRRRKKSLGKIVLDVVNEEYGSNGGWV